MLSSSSHRRTGRWWARRPDACFGPRWTPGPPPAGARLLLTRTPHTRGPGPVSSPPVTLLPLRSVATRQSRGAGAAGCGVGGGGERAVYTVQGLGAAWGRGGGQTGVVGNTAFAVGVNSLHPAPLSELHRRDRALVRPESLSLCVPTSPGAAPPKALLLGLKLG